MKKKILVIDDDPQFIFSLKQLLEAKSYQVITARSGKEGLEIAEAELPDLVTIDVMMETWSEGFKVVDKLRENEKTSAIPRILLTSLGLESKIDEISSQLMGVESILQKPIQPASFLEYVRKSIGE
ncbi:MAG: response regulator [Candidatus Aminicenantes bacterium]|jgi:CheY-like chemotaxis protein